MKMNSVMLSFAILISTQSFAQEGPKKEETVEFIMRNIGEKGGNFFGDYRYFDKSLCSFSIKIGNGKMVVTDIGNSRFYISQAKYDPVYMLMGSCMTGSCRIYSSKQIDREEQSFDMPYFNEHIRDKSYAESLSKAFNHLRYLCSGKKDLF